mgnify:CR=1 FL=1
MSSDTPRVGVRAATRAVAALAVLLTTGGSVLAHSGHVAHDGTSGGGGVLLPAAVLGGGVLVVGTSVVLERRGEISGRLRDLGTILGLVSVLAGLTLVLV